MQQSPGSQHGWWLLQGPCRSCITSEKGERYSCDTWQRFLGAQCFWVPPCIPKNSLQEDRPGFATRFWASPFSVPPCSLPGHPGDCLAPGVSIFFLIGTLQCTGKLLFPSRTLIIQTVHEQSLLMGLCKDLCPSPVPCGRLYCHLTGMYQSKVFISSQHTEISFHLYQQAEL